MFLELKQLPCSTMSKKREFIVENNNTGIVSEVNIYVYQALSVKPNNVEAEEHVQGKEQQTASCESLARIYIRRIRGVYHSFIQRNLVSIIYNSRNASPMTSFPASVAPYLSLRLHLKNLDYEDTSI